MPIVEVPGHGDVEFPDSMSDAEIVTAIKKIVPPAAPPAPAKPQVSGGLAFGRGAAQGAQLAFGDEIEGAVQAVGQKLFGPFNPQYSTKPIGQLYRESRDASRREYKDAEKAHPGLYLAGNLAGGLAPSVVAGGTWAAEPAYGAVEMLQKAAKTGAMAAGLGSASALGDTEASGAVDQAKAGLKGAALGLGLTAAGQALVPPVAKVAGKLYRGVVNGVVKPSAEAVYLAAKGAKDLTLGQMAPKSWINSIEQAAESIPFVGDVIKRQRQAGRESWQRAVLNEARPPGTSEVGPTRVADAVGDLLGDFEKAYSPIKSVPVGAAVQTPQGSIPLAGALRAAAEDPGVLATDATRKAVGDFLDNAHSALVKKAANGGIQSGDLLGVRSAIRAEIRNALNGPQPDYKTAQLLRNGEAAITASLESQLPADAAQALRATDQQYSKLMRVVDAVRRGGDQPGGFTPAQLSQAVKGGAEKTSYAAGGGGELRQLARAGRETLDTTVPPTGARLLTMGLGTAALPVTTGIAGLATTNAGKRFLTGATGWQRTLQHSDRVNELIRALRFGAKSPYLLGDIAEAGGEHIPQGD